MRFLMALLLTVTLLLLAVAAVNHHADPSGLRALQQPDWSPACGTGIRTERRWALPLLAELGRAEAIMLGNSRSYRGFTYPMAADFFGTPAVLNLGLPALHATELPALTDAALRAGTAKQALLGMHYGMFAYPPQARPPARHSRWLPAALRARAQAYLSLTATTASLRQLRGRCRPAAWRPQGFESGYRQRASRFFTAADAHGFIHPQEVLLDQRLQHAPVPAHYRHSLAAFEATLAQGCRRGLHWHLYIDPVHRRLQDILARHGRQAAMAQWLRDVTGIAATWQARGCRLTLTDFSAPHALLDSPFATADGRYGSNAHFFEATHFTPRLGQCLLNRLRGQAHDCPLPFGQTLTSTPAEALPSARPTAASPP